MGNKQREKCNKRRLWFGAVLRFLVAAGACRKLQEPPKAAPSTADTTVVGTRTVPALPPESVPAAIYDPENLITDSPLMSGTFPRNIVVVLFDPDAPQEERQTAIDLIDGEVVGGMRSFGDDGFYLVRIQDDGTAGPLFEAIEMLEALPQVRLAGVDHIAPASEWIRYRRPTDGNGYSKQDWKLVPDSALGYNWGLEAVAAPLA